MARIKNYSENLSQSIVSNLIRNSKNCTEDGIEYCLNCTEDGIEYCLESDLSSIENYSENWPEIIIEN